MIALSKEANKLIRGNPSEFLKAVQELSEYLGILPEWLLTCFYMESTFNPSAVNKFTNAVGLIQFMPATLNAMGYTKEQVLSMSPVQQMEVVKKYFQSKKGKLKSLTDVYLTIFYPVAIGKPDSFVIGSEASKAFSQKVGLQNAVYDSNKDGVITKGEIKKKIEAVYFHIFPDQKKRLFYRFLKTL